MTNTSPNGRLDQRRSPRKTIFKQGVAGFGEGGGKHKCIVHCISAHGAKISPESPAAAPDRFDLVVGSESYVCRRVWQHDSSIGIEFIDAEEPANTGTDQHQDKQHQDKRQHKRIEVLRRGRIIYNGAFSVMECVIIDTSDSGARIRPTDVLSCPDTFKLSIESGPSYACRVVRRQGEEIGVQFLDRPEAN